MFGDKLRSRRIKCTWVMDQNVVHSRIRFETFELFLRLNLNDFVFLSLNNLQTIEKLPDKVVLNIFAYLTHLEICRVARVCRRWRQIAYDTRLWKNVSLRPEISGLHVSSLETLLALISVRFGPSLRYIELPIELITHTVLHELAAKCPNLTHMLLDFSTGWLQIVCSLNTIMLNTKTFLFFSYATSRFQ